MTRIDQLIEGTPTKIRAKAVPKLLQSLWSEGDELTLVPLLRDKDQVLVWETYKDEDGKLKKRPDVTAKKGTVLTYIIRDTNGNGWYSSTITNAVGFKSGRFENLFEKI
jgi:hypothetical protein